MRKRRMARRKLTPALQAEICRRMWEGRLSLNQIAKQPDMPSANTLVRWQRDMPQFRDRIAQARQMLLDLLIDDVADIADTVTPATAAIDRARFAALRKRVADLEARDPRRRF
jgi:transposase-like protein